MTIKPGFAATAIFAGLALGLAAPGSAAPEMSGHYAETETNVHGVSTSNDWYFTPCGEGCAIAMLPRPAQARLVGGQWVMDILGDNSTCDNGSIVPHNENSHFTWDPNTLVGTVVFTNIAAACGNPPGTSQTNKIQLSKAP
jgi:hypothetical protein